MTDQKIEEIGARAEKHLVAMLVRSVDAEMLDDNEKLIRDCLTELDRLKARVRKYAERLEITSHYVSVGDGPLERVEVPESEWDSHIDGIEARNETIKLLDANIATLKASGTFSDGVEAAAKWHDEVARNMQYRIDNARGTVSHTFTGEMQRHKEHAAAIRALSPQPRPDAQAQREALAEFCYGKGYNDAQWHKDGKTAAELVEAFDRSQP